MKRILYQSAIVGFIQAFITILILTLYVVYFCDYIEYYPLLEISSIIPAIVYFWLNRKETKTRNIFLFLLGTAIYSVIFFIALFQLYLKLQPIYFQPARALVNSDGLLMLVVQGTFILYAFYR